MAVRLFLIPLAGAIGLVACSGPASEPPAAETVPDVAPVAEAPPASAPVEPIAPPEPPPPPPPGFSPFAAEVQKVIKATSCRTGKTMRDPGLPALWGCISGSQETVKLFINEVDGEAGRVANVKLMWNDWTRDIGYGLHADKALATKWAEAIAQTYAPDQVSEVTAAFAAKRNRVITSEHYVLTYTYDQGPAIGERLIVITERPK